MTGPALMKDYINHALDCHTGKLHMFRNSGNGWHTVPWDLEVYLHGKPDDVQAAIRAALKKASASASEKRRERMDRMMSQLTQQELLDLVTKGGGL